MEITCPCCQHSAEVDENLFPLRKGMLLCPKCDTQFMFGYIDKDENGDPIYPWDRQPVDEDPDCG